MLRRSDGQLQFDYTGEAKQFARSKTATPGGEKIVAKSPDEVERLANDRAKVFVATSTTNIKSLGVCSSSLREDKFSVGLWRTV